MSVNGVSDAKRQAASAGFFATVKRFFSGSDEPSSSLPAPPKRSVPREAPEPPKPSSKPEKPPTTQPASVSLAEKTVVVTQVPEPVESPPSVRRALKPAKPVPPETKNPPANKTNVRRDRQPEPLQLPKAELPKIIEHVSFDSEDQTASINSGNPRDIILNRYPQKIRNRRDLKPESSQAISLVSEEKVWVEIYDKDGELLKDMVMQPNQIFRVPKGMTFFVSLGNAGAIRVRIGSQKLPYLGRPGEVVQELELSPKALRERGRR